MIMTHTHFIGIGGTGLSAIAKVLLERGEKVSGSDQQKSPTTESIRKAGAKVFIGHKAKNIRGADVVVRSSAVQEENPEVIAARDAGIPVLKRRDYFKNFLDERYTIAVSGSHGKTTTTSMIAWILSVLNMRPGFIVGGVVQNLSTNASAGASDFFAIEADEYDYMFWGLTPEIAVVTNVEHDHPDCFPTPKSFEEAFEGFVDRIAPEGTLVANLDDPGARKLLDYALQQGRKVVSYSLGNRDADYRAESLKPERGAGYHFEMKRNGEPEAVVSLQVPGEHNVSNALAALVVVDLLGLNLREAAEALKEFVGSGRRFDEIGEVGGVVVVDDYGHHPTEIRSTLAAARARYPDRRIWAVWQPHTYTRTQQLLPDFGKAFKDADRVIVTKVYAARETQPDDFSHQSIMEAIPQETRLIHELDDTANYLLEHVKSGDLVIVFSAGDAVEVSSKVFAGLIEQEVAA
jgi:UDP-N-acetylmuramate--alanine ligase